MNIIEANGYDVLFGMDSYAILGEYLNTKAYSSIMILTDDNCNENCLPHFLANLPTEIPFEIIEIESGEQHKNLETCAGVLQSMVDLGADRNSVLITVGGGVVSDLGGFVASVYMRGIDSIYIPTTLLAMVDASVGGKTGVDLEGVKNIVGTFSMPTMVVIDETYLKTLEGRQIKAGYAEMLKHGLIADKDYFNYLLDISNIDFSDIEALILHSVAIKNDVVMNDPTEKGKRQILNFGHTIGHAIESYFLQENHKGTVLHGEAVAAGMIIEAYISLQVAGLSTEEYNEIRDGIDAIFDRIDLAEGDLLNVMNWMKFDKKNVDGKIRMVLLSSIGQSVYGVEVDNELIYNAIKVYID